MKKLKDNPADAKVEVTKRIKDVQSVAPESKKRKKHQDQHKTSSDSLNIETAHVSKKSKKQHKEIKLPEEASLPQHKQENDLSPAKKQKNKIKNQVENSGITQATAKSSKKRKNKNIQQNILEEHSDSVSTEIKLKTKKRKKSLEGKQNLVKENKVLSKADKETSLNDGSEPVKKKKKKESLHGEQNLVKENKVLSKADKETSLNDGSKPVKKKKKKVSLHGEQNLVKESGVSSKADKETSLNDGSKPVKKKKKKESLHGEQNLVKENGVSSRADKETSVNNGSTPAKKKKKKKKNKYLKEEMQKMPSESPLPAKSLQKKIKPKLNNKTEKSSPAGKVSFPKKQNQKDNAHSPKELAASMSSKKTKSKVEVKVEKGESAKQTQILPLRGRALKKHIEIVSETIDKLREFYHDQAIRLLKTVSAGNKRKIKQRMEKIKEKVAKLESDLAVYQKNTKRKTTETLKDKVYIGLPEDPPPTKKKDKPVELKDFLQKQMKASRFRWLNENLYLSSSEEAKGFFKDDPESFKAYHEGYSEQVAKWPVNPLEVIIEGLRSLPEDTVVADLGCGEAKLAEALPNLKIHSLDFIAIKPEVIACDMAHCPLLRSSIDIAVFCLSLMGTNISDFLLEANRILKIGGTMEIAEVESRFESVEDFIEKVKKYGFELKKKNPIDMFFFLTFTKTQDVTRTKKLPEFDLKACVYKKR